MSKIVTCIEENCGAQFEITDGEQEFFESKGFDLPKRCKPCRSKRKAQKNHNEINK